MKCNTLGDPKCHAGCLAQKALTAKQPEYRYSKNGDWERIGFWIPLEDYPDFFLHFTVGFTIDYKIKQEKNLNDLLRILQ
jgi:hypothetical protein